MERESFNEGWSVRPRASSFLESFTGGAAWEPVRLPHDAMLIGDRDPTGSPAVAYFRGGAWEYRKRFYVPEERRDRRMFVEFEGVYRSAAVYVNDTFAGHRPYGYSNFYIPLDHLVDYGADNVIRVEATAHEDSRWYSGAGIYRDTSLIVGHRVHIALDGVRITTPAVDEDVAVVEVATTVENDGAALAMTTLRTDLVDASGAVFAWDEASVAVSAAGSATLRQRMAIDRPQRWSVDEPNLYECRSMLATSGSTIDAEVTTFGIRSVQLDPRRGLRINGDPVKLRGACVHHDNGVLGAATIRRAEERRVELMKAAGFNAVRSAHHPMSKAMLEACDRLGMLVMDETFDMWATPKTNSDYARSFPEWWHGDVAAMVAKDFNHPSVILYSIGNEIPDVGTPAAAAQGRAIAEAVRALDGSRYLTVAVNPLASFAADLFAPFARSTSAGEDPGVNTLLTNMWAHLPRILQQDVVDERTAELFAAVDVAGYNYLESRYELDHELHPNRVILGTETFPTRLGANWQQVLENSHVIGDFMWTGWDYLGEVGVGRVEHEDTASAFHGPYPWLTAWVGDLDITGHRRPISYHREIVFGLRTEPYIAVQRPDGQERPVTYSSPWSAGEAIASWTWPGVEGRPVAVEVYADADEVELVLNGAVVDRAPAGASRCFRAEFEVRYEPGTLEAVSYRDGDELARTAIRTAEGPLRLELQVDRQMIRSDDRDLAFVEIALVDAQGNRHTAADRLVEISLHGPAVLQGFGSGRPRVEKPFGKSPQETFDGRALAVVRPTGSGRISVSVSADGCAPESVELLAD